jgi:hypothetical protein
MVLGLSRKRKHSDHVMTRRWYYELDVFQRTLGAKYIKFMNCQIV